MNLDRLLVLAAAAALAFGLAGWLWLLRRRARADAAAYDQNVERQLHIPPSLHPVIDPDVCIGSLSCLKACPEGDILGLVNGSARLVHGANCIGHGRCAAECPVGAIRLVFGTAERGVDLPEVDEFFESGRAGVHVVGELGGMGLIKNAVRQGLQVAERLAQTIGQRVGPAVDVAIVGAGPAGLATAIGCRAGGLSFRVLERESLGGTVAHYPRQKVVMTEPIELPLVGSFGKKLISKEELIASFEKMLKKARIQVEEGAAVTAIEGTDGDFVVKTTQGDVRARKVVLAVGRRGAPRKLGVPGEALEKVTYRLVDPEQYAGAKVLVVGGGDSALEAAIQLAEDTDAEVTLSYRGPAFGRAKPRNLQKIDGLRASRRVRVLLSSEVKLIEADRVTLTSGDRTGTIANDFVIVSIGGELPTDFLAKVGVSVKRVHGDEAPRPSAPKGLARADPEVRARRRLAAALWTVGALILGFLAYRGWDYYTLDRKARLASELHETMKPAGTWGHGVGIVATLFMMSNFLYPIRKRWVALKSSGTIRTWLTFHMFVGFMSPLVIAFHAAFQSNNTLATLTAGSLGVVVLTGVIGRFLYGLVPTGRAAELADLSRTFEVLADKLASSTIAVARLIDRARTPPVGFLPFHLAGLPLQAAWVEGQLLRVRAEADPGEYLEIRYAVRRLFRLRTQVAFFATLRRLLSGWRVFHAGLAVFLVLIIAAHIGVSLYLGYGWIFF